VLVAWSPKTPVEVSEENKRKGERFLYCAINSEKGQLLPN